jgi:hypothetical protein
MLGGKLFVINSYMHDEAADRPFLRGGMWWNPIVQTHGRDLAGVWAALAAECSLLVTMDRPSLAAACRARDELRPATTVAALR